MKYDSWGNPHKGVLLMFHVECLPGSEVSYSSFTKALYFGDKSLFCPIDLELFHVENFLSFYFLKLFASLMTNNAFFLIFSFEGFRYVIWYIDVSCGTHQGQRFSTWNISFGFWSGRSCSTWKTFIWISASISYKYPQMFWLLFSLPALMFLLLL